MVCIMDRQLTHTAAPRPQRNALCTSNQKNSTQNKGGALKVNVPEGDEGRVLGAVVSLSLRRRRVRRENVLGVAQQLKVG